MDNIPEVDRVAELEQALSKSRAEAARLLNERNDARERLARLRSNPVIAAGAAVSRPLRKALRAIGPNTAERSPLEPCRNPSIPVPPNRLMFMDLTEEKFLANGDRLLLEVSELAGLTSETNIFDIGCGYGRFVHSLLRTGRYSGRYHGFDILKRHIDWCIVNLEPLGAGRIKFDHLDIHSGRYNSSGTLTAEEVVFPFQGTADLILLLSVFTHMHAGGIRNYLSQLADALPNGGQVLATFFLMNESWRELEVLGRSRFPLPYALSSTCRYMNPDDSLHVIAYSEGWVRNEIEAAGLGIRSVSLGGWCGRRDRRV